MVPGLRTASVETDVGSGPGYCSVMHVSDEYVPVLGRSMTVRRPDGPTRGGVVALHGATSPERDQPLFGHLADTLTPLGYAVASYDRRSHNGGGVPLHDQATDALAGLEYLRERIGAPVGLYGFSQGAWAASVAAARSADVAFLAVLGCSGVSPAAQMRYFTDESLRRAGHGEAERAAANRIRLAVEAVLRGEGDRDELAALLGAATGEPWWPLAWLPDHVPAPGGWADMDFDPQPTFARVTCPTLLMYGEDEENVPAAPSIAVWRRASPADLTVATIARCGHFPSPDGGQRRSDIASAYGDALAAWF